MKNNIDFYPHKSNAHRHPKFLMLRSLFENIHDGWAAEGRFWALNNIIAESDDCVLDLNKNRNLAFCARELDMSIPEFSALINIFSGENVELLAKIDEGIYTTNTVQETYSSVMVDRKAAQKRYHKRKESVNSTTSEENDNLSGENQETSGEVGYKVNRSEVKGIEENKKKVNEKEQPHFPLETSFSKTSHLEKIKNLFKTHTRISDPNEKSHLEPIVNFYKQVPELLTGKDIDFAITTAFEGLTPNKGVKMEFLLDNIQKNITAALEKANEKRKQVELKEANQFRNEQKELEKQKDEQFRQEKLKQYGEFLRLNPKLFTPKEVNDLTEFLKKKRFLEAGAIVEPKMESIELT